MSLKTHYNFCRAIIVGICLSVIHVAGIIVSIYILGVRLADPDMPEKAVYHVCTSAILCPAYFAVEGLTGISIQLAGSVLGLAANLLLFLGAVNKVPLALLVWLICYAFAICGCFFLFGMMLNILIVRDDQLSDVHYTTFLLTIIPLLMCFLYLICWAFVFQLWRQFKRRENQVFVCVE